MEKWQFKKAYYLHAWLLAIGIFVGCHWLMSHYINHRIADIATFGCLFMWVIFLILSIFPLFRKQYVAPFILIPLTLGLGFFYLILFSLGMRMSAYDSFDVDTFLYTNPIKVKKYEDLPLPTTINHQPNFPEFLLYKTEQQGEYRYQVFLENAVAGKFYLKPFTTPLIQSVPDTDIQKKTLFSVTTPTKSFNFNNQKIYVFTQPQSFVIYQKSRWADYDVCLSLMFIPDDETLSEKNLAERCFNVQGAE